jgi:ribosomal protein L44E
VHQRRRKRRQRINDATATEPVTVRARHGDRSPKDLKFRCVQCGSRRTDAVMMGKGGVGVQPWRSEVR